MPVSPKIPPNPNPTPGVVSDLARMMRSTKFSAGTSAAQLPIRPNDQFLLRHHPTAWRLSKTLETPCYLPDVTKHVLAVGVNGIRTTNAGEPREKAYENSVWAAQRKGWTYLSVDDYVPEDCLPEGVPGGTYLRELECRDARSGQSGHHYVEAWSVPIPTLPGEQQEFRFDLASYERWLLWLIESGLIQPAMPQIAHRKLRTAEGHLERTITTPNMAPEIRAVRVAKRQAVVDAHLAAANPDKAPKAKRGGR